MQLYDRLHKLLSSGTYTKKMEFISLYMVRLAYLQNVLQISKFDILKTLGRYGLNPADTPTLCTCIIFF